MDNEQKSTETVERDYQTYTNLAHAFSSGELDKDKYFLMLDNDNCRLCYVDDSLSEEELDAKNEECVEWFCGNGYSDLAEVCDAAGIPCEWC